MAPRRAASRKPPPLASPLAISGRRLLPWREDTVTENVVLTGIEIAGSVIFGSPLLLWIVMLWFISLIADLVARLPGPFRRMYTPTQVVLTGTIIVGAVIKIVGIAFFTSSAPGKVGRILRTICSIAYLVKKLPGLFRRESTIIKRVKLGVIIVATILVIRMNIGHLTGSIAGPEGCLHVHRAAYGPAGAPFPFDVHRSLARDIYKTNCPSAAKGDYGPCLRNSLNHSQHEGRVTYKPTEAMRFFWHFRPRLLEAPPRSSIFNLHTSDKPSFNVSRLSPTQREGLILWSKCTYPSFGQNLTQPLNLSCPFQAFNLFFFHNTLGDGRMFLPTESINPHPPPEHVDVDLQDALFVSIPNKDERDRFFPPRILHIGATPLLEETPVKIEHTPHNLAKTLSQLLQEMLHVAQYIYTCPICYSRQCALHDYPDFGGLRYGQLWLPLTVVIDLMLAKEGILEIPGVNWKEHRLNLHADHVAAAMKNRGVAFYDEAELNGGLWAHVGFLSEAGGISENFRHNLAQGFGISDGSLDPSFPSWRPDPAPFMVA